MSLIKIRVALETAIDSMEGLIQDSAIAASNSGSVAVFNASGPHKLKTGVMVKVVGHTGSVPTVSGTYKFVSVTSTSFSLKDELSDIPVSLTVGGTGGTLKANLTAWENMSFSPVADVPWQKVNFILGRPENPSFGDTMSREIGIMQITLNYPKQKGTLDVMTRAELLKSQFKRGASFVSDGVTTKILRTPEIVVGGIQNDYYAVAVRIPYQADVFV